MYVYYIGQRLKRTAQVAMGGGEAADCGGFHRMLGSVSTRFGLVCIDVYLYRCIYRHLCSMLGSVSTRFGLVCIYVYLCIYINISVYIYIYIYI